MQDFDMAVEWIQYGDSPLIETEYDGMECDEFSEPYEYDNGCSGVQPNFIVQG